MSDVDERREQDEIERKAFSREATYERDDDSKRNYWTKDRKKPETKWRGEGTKSTEEKRRRSAGCCRYFEKRGETNEKGRKDNKEERPRACS